MVANDNVKFIRKSRWYYGGLSAAGACCFTHPFDLIKVQMQIQKGKNVSLASIIGYIFRKQGILGFYNGVSASVVRQLTYSTTRFAIYEDFNKRIARKGEVTPFYIALLITMFAGIMGGAVGNPADVVNVRMQNDVKLPPEKRRNYQHVFHGFYKTAKYEGILQLWSGAPLNCFRCGLMTVGQIAFYDLLKMFLLRTPYFSDDVTTHITASLGAGGIATTLTQPVDVVKTRMMNTPKSQRKSIMQNALITAKEGPLAFFKGYVPAFVRLAPHTILTFVFYEQLRLNFGILEKVEKK